MEILEKLEKAKETLDEAMNWAKANYPSASEQHKSAFANSVVNLVTGLSLSGAGGYGGPSLREHLVSWSLGKVGTVSFNGQAITFITPGRLPLPGHWTFEAAVAHAAPLCFEPAQRYLNRLIQIQEREHCFDDDPEDLEALREKK